MSPVIESVSGLRGIYPDAMNAEYAFNASCKFSSYLKNGRIAVGMDTRPSSQALARAASAGVMYSGSQAIWLGVVTTPELFHYVRNNEIEGGIMITASHNPKEWNGLKMVRKGRGLFEEELRDFLSTQCIVKEIGSKIEGDSRKYYEDILKMLGDNLKGVKLALDLGGGSASLHVPSTFRRAGGEVYAVNASAGIFTRTIDPTQDSLEQLVKIIKVAGCDIGLAFDCDGDRLQVVDSHGVKLPPDYTLYLAIKNAEDIDRVVLSVDTSDVVVEEAKRRGMKIFFSPVGEANVLKVMLENECRLGGEGSSAGVIDSRFSYCRDGLLASAYVMRELAEAGSLDLAELDGHEVIRKKLEIDRGSSDKIMRELEREYPDATKIDGIKISFGDGWCLVRMSRTEQALRISVEGRSRARAEEILDTMSRKISGLMREG
ncbi:MAG: hypothetical protein QXE12_05615 [Conexivisphaerales archaeon]